MSTSDAFAAVQGLLGIRVFARMLATSAGDPVAATVEIAPGTGSVAAIVPVLNERERLGPCLAGLRAQPSALAAIVVVDGGSTDGTQELVREAARLDARVRLVDATPLPAGWNGKAWNLACGLAATDPVAQWVLTLDADVRAEPHLIASLLAHAATAYVDAFSAAPLLEVSPQLESILHPAFLTTLVYRRGLPGNVARSAREVQANGQCFFVRRSLLVGSGAFSAARASRCDDVTIARQLVRGGAQVGFYEGSRIARVRMYAGARDCWQNWPRSLPLRDGTTTLPELLLGLAEIALVQALPLPLLATLATLTTLGARAAPVRRSRVDSLFFRVNLALALARLGVLAGTRRAYAEPAPAYWLSPLADGPAVLRIVRSAFARRPSWRGVPLVPQGGFA